MLAGKDHPQQYVRLWTLIVCGVVYVTYIVFSCYWTIKCLQTYSRYILLWLIFGTTLEQISGDTAVPPPSQAKQTNTGTGMAVLSFLGAINHSLLVIKLVVFLEIGKVCVI